MPRKHPTKGYVQLKCKLSTRSITSKADPQKSKNDLNYICPRATQVLKRSNKLHQDTKHTMAADTAQKTCNR